MQLSALSQDHECNRTYRISLPSDELGSAGPTRPNHSNHRLTSVCWISCTSSPRPCTRDPADVIEVEINSFRTLCMVRATVFPPNFKQACPSHCFWDRPSHSDIMMPAPRAVPTRVLTSPGTLGGIPSGWPLGINALLYFCRPLRVAPFNYPLILSPLLAVLLFNTRSYHKIFRSFISLHLSSTVTIRVSNINMPYPLVLVHPLLHSAIDITTLTPHPCVSLNLY